ncbi:MAG: hypothetical protein HOO95_01180 [Gallionella sp.]|nr:hypothetical protein [Gallionella sp.]
MTNKRSVSAILFGTGLFMTTSAFAETDAEHMARLESKLDAMQTELSQMTSGMAHHSAGSAGIPLHGFSDIGFASNTDSDLASNPKGFFVGSLSFYLAPTFGDRVKALIEPNIEVTPADDIAVDLERAQFGYSFSDTVTLWGGRFHTPYGYWNTGFHHGGQMQTSVMRPRFLDFEDKGGILPAHMVGVWGAGKIKAGTGKVAYDVYAGNGPTIAMGVPDPAISATAQTLGTLTIGQAGDNNHQAMTGFNMGYEFSGNFEGLKLSAHGLQGDVDDNSNATITSLPSKLANNKTELSMLGGSAVYLENDWEILSEYYGFNNTNKSGSNTGTHKSWAAYAQVGKSFDDWTPYLRFEKTVLDQNDNYFASQASGQSYARQSLGVRYNLNPNSALKFELLDSKFEARGTTAAKSFNSVVVQYAIGF